MLDDTDPSTGGATPLPDLNWSKTRIADWLDLDRRKVARLLEQIEPAYVRGNVAYYRLRDAIQAIYQRSEVIDPDRLMPRERKDWYDSEARRLEVEKAKRELVPIDEYRGSMASVLKEIARDLETWPDRAEREFGAGADIVEMLECFVDGARERLYQRLLAIDEQSEAEAELETIDIDT